MSDLISKQTAEQPEKRTEKRTETHACDSYEVKTHETSDCISREALQEWIKDKTFGDIVVASEHNFDCLPSIEMDNHVNLCDSCKYNYPDCPSGSKDVVFGNGEGNDNICACSKYKPVSQPETCDGCKNNGKWEDEVEYGYSSPCTTCKRRAMDNYER